MKITLKQDGIREAYNLENCRIMQPNTSSGNVAASSDIAGLGTIGTRASFYELYCKRIVFTDRLKTFFVGHCLSILHHGTGTELGTK